MGQTCLGANGLSSPRDARGRRRSAEVPEEEMRVRRKRDQLLDNERPAEEDQVPKEHRVCNICYICLPPWGSWEDDNGQSGNASDARFAVAAPRR
mmetsp:Transcript_57454/g.168223  ORF Transcript_57454/g.168223 Transcript_57454/m.168223 type:complete len:95 (+) Transcript_57454:63-347(+)